MNVDDETLHDERTAAMWVHLKSLTSPLLGFLGGPLLLRKISNEAGPYVKKHCNAASNFQLTIAVYCGILYALAIIVGSTIHDFVDDEGVLESFVTYLIVATLAIFLFWFAMTIRAAIRARHGLDPPYPKLPFAVHQEQWEDLKSSNQLTDKST